MNYTSSCKQRRSLISTEIVVSSWQTQMGPCAMEIKMFFSCLWMHLFIALREIHMHQWKKNTKKRRTPTFASATHPSFSFRVEFTLICLLSFRIYLCFTFISFTSAGKCAQRDADAETFSKEVVTSIPTFIWIIFSIVGTVLMAKPLLVEIDTFPICGTSRAIKIDYFRKFRWFNGTWMFFAFFLFASA